jgi:hypothetical protein
MYPGVATVVGNAHEFHEMCSQYQIRSFPKLLMFKDGYLLGRYEKFAGDAPALAQQFARWTKQLPKARPLAPSKEPQQVLRRQRLMRDITATGPIGHLVARVLSFVAARVPQSIRLLAVDIGNRSELRVFRRLVQVFMQYPMEPFVGTFANSAEYDAVMYIFCVLYVASRLVAWLMASRRRRAVAER